MKVFDDLARELGEELDREIIEKVRAVARWDEVITQEADRTKWDEVITQEANPPLPRGDYPLKRHVVRSILIPAIRRVFPRLLAEDIVGVQPMSAPTGYA